MLTNRQIILDTETTGLSPELGHRIIEIGCIELIERRATGRVFHYYLNPQREVDEQAFKVHGLSNQFLADKPLFSSIANEFIDFIKNSEVIIHNAAFDIGFINAELKKISFTKCIQDFCVIVDTLELARMKHPGQRNNLDALCKRYQVDSSNREFHGALLDAQLLADVYLAMTSGQKKMDFTEVAYHDSVPQNHLSDSLSTTSPIIFANQNDLMMHQKFLDMIREKNGKVIWDEYFQEMENENVLPNH